MEQKFKHFAEVDISINIKSNRGYTQTANLMGNPYNLLDTSNAATEYKWDLTGFVFSTETYVTLEYRDVNVPSFSLFTQDLAAQSLDAVVNALNLLGIGFFYLDTTGGTFITTSNDNYVFGNLAIEPTSGTTTTTTTTSTTAAPTTTTTTTSTTAAPTTTTTTTSTTAAPTTTTTTTSTTTAGPTTTTTTSTTTSAPTTTTTTTSTTAAPTTTTTTTTTTIVFYTFCLGYDASSSTAACNDYLSFCT
jgi:hypothetical protein